MFIEPCRPFTIQHVRGTDATQAVADGLSRLHVANLALSATPDELDGEAELQAELGEGGMDAEMFETHTCTVANAWAGIINNTIASQLEEEWQQAKVIPPTAKAAMAERQTRYGKGCQMLEKMGWTVTSENHRKMSWETQQQANHQSNGQSTTNRRPVVRRPGIGFKTDKRQIEMNMTDKAGMIHVTMEEVEAFDCEYLGTVNTTSTERWATSSTQAQTQHKAHRAKQAPKIGRAHV
jgi:hypothetical protein